ncbi:MAG TPA: DUF3341 domain-containing protein, partial [Bacteroidales bacterium]|nr:DUF3341 domain-containing protein [Bacteroidales bacterium]
MAAKFKIGVFSEEEKMIASLAKLLDSGVSVHDVYMPYPVHEALHLLKRKSRIPTAAYFYGLFGAIAVLAFLYYAAVISWPIVYGGKPFNSFPSFIVITVVLTILVVTIASLATFSAVSGLFPGSVKPIPDIRATDDKFIIVINIANNGDDKTAEASRIFDSEGAEE